MAERPRRWVVPGLLAAVLAGELAVAILRHRSSDELVQLARSGATRSRIDALFKLARRGDGGKLSRELVLGSFAAGDARLRAFVLMEAHRPLERREWDALVAGIDDAEERELVAELAERFKSRERIAALLARRSRSP